MRVENNDFGGADVVLFNTFNSRFKSEEIEEFGRQIEKSGGKLVDPLFSYDVVEPFSNEWRTTLRGIQGHCGGAKEGMG